MSRRQRSADVAVFGEVSSSSRGPRLPKPRRDVLGQWDTRMGSGDGESQYSLLKQPNEPSPCSLRGAIGLLSPSEGNGEIRVAGAGEDF